MKNIRIVFSQLHCWLLESLVPWRHRRLIRLDSYNVIWTTPSENAHGSMPLGNGDVGINAWVEANGDLIFYVSKTDAWDENARLCKIGRIRVKFDPPLAPKDGFRQELKLRDGVIEITSKIQNQPSKISLVGRLGSTGGARRGGIGSAGHLPGGSGIVATARVAVGSGGGLRLWRRQEPAGTIIQTDSVAGCGGHFRPTAGGLVSPQHAIPLPRVPGSPTSRGAQRPISRIRC